MFRLLTDYADPNKGFARKRRDAGLLCEVFLKEKKLTRQYIAAEKKGIPWAIIPGEGESQNLTLRNLTNRENREGLDIEGIVALVRGGVG
jgi:histidyl-tRNA synthetase